MVINNYGLGVSSDSTAYLDLAKNISEFRGIVNYNGRFINQWPPFYPVLLGAFTFVFGIDTLLASSLLNIFLVFICSLIFYSILNYLKVEALHSLILCLILIISTSFTVFLWAWSEPLFITILAVSTLYFLKWESQQKRRYLLIVSLLSGLLLLTRYAAVGFILGYSFYIFALIKGPLKVRIFNVLIYLSIILIVTLPWFSFNYFQSSENGTLREFAIHFVSKQKLNELLLTLKSWVFPNWKITLLVLTGFCVQAVAQYKFYQSTNKVKSSFLPGILIISYLFFLLTSISFFDFHTPLDNRILSPLFPLLVIIYGQYIVRFNEDFKMKIVSYFLTFILFVSVATSSISLWKTHYIYGSGYTSDIWTDSQVINYARKIKKKFIYTNANDILGFQSSIGQDSIRLIPFTIDAKTMKENEDLKEQMNKMKAFILNNKSVLVYLNNVTWRWYLVEPEVLIKELDGVQLIEFDDGFVIRNN